MAPNSSSTRASGAAANSARLAARPTTTTGSGSPASAGPRAGGRGISPWWFAFVILLGLHLWALFAHHAVGWPYAAKPVFLFHVDFERNLPTLFSVLLLARAAAWCGWAGRFVASPGIPPPRPPGTRADRRSWFVLAAVFAFLAADEALSLHEALTEPVTNWLRTLGDTGSGVATSPLLTFSWILPYSLLVAALGLALLGWLRRLQPRTRRTVVTAALLYLSGALLVEAIGGWWIDGDLRQRDLGYDLWVTLEESLEMIGLLVFTDGVRRFLNRPR